MALDNFQLPFDRHNTQQMPIRNRPDKYANSPLAERFRFEVSEGVRPAEYFGVYKHLPALQKDISTDDYIVLPKGRIVSALSTEQTNPAGGIVNPSESGEIPAFVSETTGSTVSVSQDGSYFGYDDYISSLIVPANGGTALTTYYTAADVAAQTMKADGTIAVAGDELVIPANKPVGVVFHDWYQDIRGKYLNYRMWADGGHVLCDWFVEVPYVKVGNSSPLGSGITPVADNADVADLNAKFAVNSKFTYLAIDDNDTNFVPGSLVTSDLIGNYTLQANDAKTVQTVGKIIGIDNRFPKSNLDEVQTYPGSNMPGTQTAGLPSFLFEFVTACQSLTGTPATVEDVINYVRSGYYGIARIQLSVA